MSANVTSQISLDDPASGNYKNVPHPEDQPDHEAEFAKLWTAITRLKEGKVDVDTFETKMYEIEQELEGEEDYMQKLQGELKRSPKRQKS